MRVCLSKYTVTDHGSILAVNKFYTCTNLVISIFKSFVSCNLRFQAFYVRTARFSVLYIEKLIFQKVETARLLAPHVYGLLNLNIHFFAPFVSMSFYY